MKVILSNQAEKFLDDLHHDKYRKKLWEMIDHLELDPIPYKKYDLKKIEGTKNSYRLRKGDFRIIYAYDNETKTVHITSIDRRKRAYKKR